MSKAIDEEKKRRQQGSSLLTSHQQEEKLPIEYYKGMITEVAGKTVKVVMLPDWGLLYVDVTPAEMPEIRRILSRAGQRIVKVTDQRIYFQLGE